VISKLRPGLFLITVIGAVIGMDRTSSSAILNFEFALTLPDYPSRMAWSPDNRFLAATQFNTGQALLIDVVNKRPSDQVMFHPIHDSIMAWSPDSRFMALNSPTALALVSVADWKEVARLKTSANGCWFQHSDSLSFTPDSQAVWISCIQRGTPSQYTAALKLRVPTLEVVDRLEMDSPIPGNRTNNGAGDRITSDNKLIVLSSMIGSCSEEKNADGAHRCVNFLYGFDLHGRLPLFSPFAIKDDADPFRVPAGAQVAQNGRVAVVSWTPPSQQPPHGPNDIRLETFDTSSGLRLAAYGGPADVQQLAISDFTFSRSGGLVIGALSDLVKKQGGLRVWDARTGKLLENLETPPASFLRLSPDGTHLAVIVLKEIRIFRVTG
jgi:hypothetical protein